jgi:hypothetical protein
MACVPFRFLPEGACILFLRGIIYRVILPNGVSLMNGDEKNAKKIVAA